MEDKAIALLEVQALVAAITAAIEAYRAENEKTNSAFRVVSFRQKKSAGGWMGNDNQ